MLHDLPPIREIVLTRPEGSNAVLREALAAARPALPLNVEPEMTVRPVLAVRPLPDGGQLPEALTQMQPEDLVVFVSPRAVDVAEAVRPLREWLPRHVAAVGVATGRALAAAGRTDAVLPDGSEDSEGLLERLDRLDKLPMDGRAVWIIRAKTGRGLLAKSLAARGARPHFVAVYQSECPEAGSVTPPGPDRLGPDRLWIVTAPQAIDCLAALSTGTDGGGSGLLDSSLLVINERARDRARALGFRGPIAIAGGPGPETLARATWDLVIERQSSSLVRPRQARP